MDSRVMDCPVLVKKKKPFSMTQPQIGKPEKLPQYPKDFI